MIQFLADSPDNWQVPCHIKPNAHPPRHAAERASSYSHVDMGRWPIATNGAVAPNNGATESLSLRFGDNVDIPQHSGTRVLNIMLSVGWTIRNRTNPEWQFCAFAQ